MPTVVSIKSKYGTYYVVDKEGTITTKREMATEFATTPEAWQAAKRGMMFAIGSYIDSQPGDVVVSEMKVSFHSRPRTREESKRMLDKQVNSNIEVEAIPSKYNLEN